MYSLIINGEEKRYGQSTTYRQIAMEYRQEYNEEILLVMLNNRLVELGKTVSEDGILSFVTGNDEAGMNTYRRSALLLMLRAIFDLKGKEVIKNLFVQFSISKGLYCTIEGFEITDEFLIQVKSRMAELADMAIPFDKISISTRDAIKRFKAHGMERKAELFRYRRVSSMNLYKLGAFEDYFYGYMVPDTSYIKYFDLFKYDEGFVLQLPSKKAPKIVPAFVPQPKLFNTLKERTKWSEAINITTVGELNNCLVSGGGLNLMLIQEAIQEKKIGDIAKEIASRKDVKIIMIAGPSSSGKTTFSHRLSVQLRANGLTPHPIAVDNYFVNREDTPKDENGKYNFECLGAVDVKGFNDDMLKLLAGETVDIPEFDFREGKREYKGNYLTLGDDDVLVIEGIHCLNDEMSYALPKESKYKIYISALTTLNIDEHNRIPTTDGRLIRRIVRDARTRGTTAKNTIAMWDSVRRGEEENIFPYQEDADVMFNSALIYEIAALKQYVEPALFGIREDEPEYSEAKRLLKFLDFFVGVPSEDIPKNSLIREFVGGGCFKI